MARWKPDARRRLQDAALDLYEEHGFAGITVAAVAERAGLTERTFYRHFTDRHEVLFGDASALREVLVEAIAATPAHVPLFDAAMTGLDALGKVFQENRARLVRRATIIKHAPELRERELMKLDSWTNALQQSLLERGAAPPLAAYAATVSMAVFRTAVVQWMDDSTADDDTLNAEVRRGFARVGDFLTRQS